MAHLLGASSSKKRRAGEEGDEFEAAAAAAGDEDRISALPDELRQRILSRLTFKDAIRTGVLARGWRDLWKSRWPHRASVEVCLSSPDDLRRELEALAREPRPRRRLDRFSLVVENEDYMLVRSKKDCRLNYSELRSFTEYAAECRVEDLHVEYLQEWRRSTLKGKFNFPLSSPLLVRLSLRHIGVITSMYYKGARPFRFRALEVIRLHSVDITREGFKNMMALCPSLLTLDLRGCDCGSFFYQRYIYGDPDPVYSKRHRLVMPPNLRTVTVADCRGFADLNLVPVPSLRSFCYRANMGDFLDARLFLPSHAALNDLYIQFAGSVAKLYSTTELSNYFSLPEDLSGLNVLTICCNALKVASHLLVTGDGANGLLPNINLHNLRELQLIMLEMEAANLADLYVFFKTFQCPNLERLFVQLPASSGKPMEGGSTDEVREEPPEDDLDSLLMVKVMNFNWRHSEVQLVSFLLRKASSLRKLLIVSPNVTPPDLPCVEEDLLLLKEALANGKIILSESDDITTQPYHSKVFIMD